MRTILPAIILATLTACEHGSKYAAVPAGRVLAAHDPDEAHLVGYAWYREGVVLTCRASSFNFVQRFILAVQNASGRPVRVPVSQFRAGGFEVWAEDPDPRVYWFHNSHWHGELGTAVWYRGRWKESHAAFIHGAASRGYVPVTYSEEDFVVPSPGVAWFDIFVSREFPPTRSVKQSEAPWLEVRFIVEGEEPKEECVRFKFTPSSTWSLR